VDAYRVTPTQVPLSDTETILIGLVVAVVVIASVTWPLVQHFQVMAHEGMHAVVGSMSGGTVAGIYLNGDATGATDVDVASGLGNLVTSFVGYLGPSAFGLGAARLIQYGHIVVVLWLVMGFLALLLISLKRRSFGYVTVPLAGFLIYLVLKHTPQSAQILAAYAITWFLLLAGVRRVLQVGANASDAGDLRDITSIPRLVWFLLWLAGTVAAVLIGAKWMLHPAVHPPAATPSG
jgi:Peptidase M50B-like